MKHFFSIFITIILVGFAAGITYVALTSGEGRWAFLYIPLLIMMFSWGEILNNNYFKK